MEYGEQYSHLFIFNEGRKVSHCKVIGQALQCMLRSERNLKPLGAKNQIHHALGINQILPELCRLFPILYQLPSVSKSPYCIFQMVEL